jgi:hypothetical protein
MRLSYRFPIVGVFLLAAASISLRAQENVLYPSLPSPIRYGVEVGGNYNMFSQTITRPLEISDSPFNAYWEAAGFSWYAMFQADYSFRKGMGVQVRLGLDRKAGGNSFSGNGAYADIRPGGSIDYQIVPMTLEYDLTATYLALSTAYRIEVDGAFAAVGPTLHFLLGSVHQVETAAYSSDGTAEFHDAAGNKIGKELQTEMDLTSGVDLRMGLEAALGYHFDLSPDVALGPVVRYQYMISSFLEDQSSGDQYRRYTLREQFPPDGVVPVQLSNRNVHSVQLGLSLQFGL